MEIEWPDVAIVMPVRNEAAHLGDAVDAVLAQRYPGSITLCLAVAPSDDGTEAIARELADRHDSISIVPNPAGSTPAGLNAAIAATSAPVVVRVDGHSRLRPGYVERAVTTLRRTGAANVGGRQVPEPHGAFELAVADATTSWLGTGGAKYRVGAQEGPTDTVYLGVFDRAAGERVGWFDETLMRNQDYELNIRLRRAGGVVWFDPELEVGYRPRSSPRRLVRQYFEYGWWKSVVLRRFPDSLRLRQLVPAALPLVLVGSLVGASQRRSIALIPLGYAASCLAAGWQRRSSPAHALRIARVLMITHLSWGVGFWVGLLDPIRRWGAGRGG